ncbi:MAG: ATP-binding protein [Angustibacter sp.]
MINGPRQCGKSTLLTQFSQGLAPVRNLDEGSVRAAALADPAGFLSGGTRPLAIDEVQRGGDALIWEIKAMVDAKQDPGQFILAGSTRFLEAPNLTESLAGRAAVLQLWPFSQGELRGQPEHFLDSVFTDPLWPRVHQSSVQRGGAVERAEYLELIIRGGFPEPARMASARSRRAWFANYAAAVTDRDIRELARINQPSAAATVLRVAAALSGQLLVATTIAHRADLSRATVDRYLGLLDAVYLVHRLPPWTKNSLVRAVKNPKIHLVDTGLAAHLLAVTVDSLSRPGIAELGPLVETFMVNELLKQATWAEQSVRFSHFRDRNGFEVDLIAEGENGDSLGFEAKAAQSVSAADFKSLKYLASRVGPSFRHGYVVYLGREVLSFGSGLTAIPLSLLWQ